MKSHSYFGRLACLYAAALLCLLIAAPTRANADPISVTITEGRVGLHPISQLMFVEFFLPGVGSVRAEAAQAVIWTPVVIPSSSGQPYRVSTSGTATFTSGELEPNVSPATGTSWRVAGHFAFEGGVATLNVHEVEDEPTNYSGFAPFLFQGTLSQYDWATGMLLRTFQLSGRGTGFASVTPVFSTTTPDRLVYSFEQAAPVPEPTTLLLTGSGLATLLAGRRRLLARRD